MLQQIRRLGSVGLWLLLSLLVALSVVPLWASAASEPASSSGTSPASGAAPASLAPHGGPTGSTEASGPTRVRIGVYLLNVGKLDIGAGTYAMDFYVSFRCDRDCQPSSFDILNGRSTAEKNDDDPRFKVFRVRADLVSQLDLRSFPFDSHKLQVVFEDKLLQDHQLVYEPDPSMTGIHPSAIVVGWRLAPTWQVQIDRDPYPVYGQSYSRATFTIAVTRPKLSAFLKNLTPALIIALSGFLALFMGPDKASQRLTLTTSALVGSVLFHINMTSSIPPIGYLTFADRIMLINYLGLATVLIINVRFLALSEAGQTDLLNKQLRGTRLWCLLIFVAAHLAHALTLRT
ncbi:MAG: hypothetical protein JNJ46_22030 [Myxococcales bacterium]|nr:hypothetical protein [Myxococcales bacterium]